MIQEENLQLHQSVTIKFTSLSFKLSLYDLKIEMKYSTSAIHNKNLC